MEDKSSSQIYVLWKFSVQSTLVLKLCLGNCDPSVQPVYTYCYSIDECCQCRGELHAPAPIYSADFISSIHVLKGKWQRGEDTGFQC